MKNNITRKTLFIITILILTLVICLSSFAWYQVGNLRKTDITVQANDGYVFRVEDIDAAQVLYASMGAANNQLTGNQILPSGAPTGSNPYNTADGTINYATLKVNYVVQNTSVAKIFEFTISDVRAYSPLAIVTVNGDAEKGSFEYNGGTYYYNGTTVFSDEEYKTVVEDYAIEGTQLFGSADEYLIEQLREELIFQFYTGGSVPVYSTLADCQNGQNSKDTTPNSTSWYTQGNEKVYISTSTNGYINIAVAINVVDDLVNRAYIGLKLKIDVDMKPVS